MRNRKSGIGNPGALRRAEAVLSSSRFAAPASLGGPTRHLHEGEAQLIERAREEVRLFEGEVAAGLLLENGEPVDHLLGRGKVTVRSPARIGQKAERGISVGGDPADEGTERGPRLAGLGRALLAWWWGLGDRADPLCLGRRRRARGRRRRACGRRLPRGGSGRLPLLRLVVRAQLPLGS